MSPIAVQASRYPSPNHQVGAMLPLDDVRVAATRRKNNSIGAAEGNIIAAIITVQATMNVTNPSHDHDSADIPAIEAMATDETSSGADSLAFIDMPSMPDMPAMAD